MSTDFAPELLAMIRCPVTKSQVSPAPPALVELLNQRIAEGNLVNRVGQTITQPIECGFINQDHSLLLPARGGIIILISDDAICLSKSDLPST